MLRDQLDLVSVVVPVYNAERHLDEALISVFKQTYSNIEIIAVDDGSQDRSVEVLQRYSQRIKLVTQPNRGSAAARNRGVCEAAGKWVAFLDADDIWCPDKIQCQLSACDGYIWSYTDSVFMGGVNDGRKDSEFSRKYQGKILEKLVLTNFVGTSSVMIRRQEFLESGGFDERLRSIQDWDLWVRLASLHDVGYVDRPLVKYRVHPASVSRITRKTLPNHLKVIEKMYAPGGAAANMRYLMPYTKASSYRICAQIAEEEGDLRFALKCAWLACLVAPASGGSWENAAKVLGKYVLSLMGG